MVGANREHQPVHELGRASDDVEVAVCNGIETAGIQADADHNLGDNPVAGPAQDMPHQALDRDGRTRFRICLGGCGIGESAKGLAFGGDHMSGKRRGVLYAVLASIGLVAVGMAHEPDTGAERSPPSDSATPQSGQTQYAAMLVDPVMVGHDPCANEAWPFIPADCLKPVGHSEPNPVVRVVRFDREQTEQRRARLLQILSAR
jgi:hypothetical protein